VYLSADLFSPVLIFHVDGRTAVPYHTSCALTRLPKKVIFRLALLSALIPRRLVNKVYASHHIFSTPILHWLLSLCYRTVQVTAICNSVHAEDALCTISDATCLRLRRLVVGTTQSIAPSASVPDTGPAIRDRSSLDRCCTDSLQSLGE
jgi:hypothetical protein